jgi:putative acetyltransferase
LNNITIKEVNLNNREEILEVYMDSFENYGAEEIQVLVSDLMLDQSAEPIVSLMAYDGEKAVGHVFFTKATIENNKLSTYILAPLGVIKEYQSKGIGGALIEKGVEILKGMAVDVVFVLGHPTYYPKYGFINNAIKEIGYEATYPIDEVNHDAWMYMPLTSMDEILKNPGRVICADAMNKPEYWTE